MKFTPLNDKEIMEQMLLPEGIYKGIVIFSSDVDKNGNPLKTKSGAEKFDIHIEVHDATGKPKTLQTVLTPAFIKRLKHFCDATDLKMQYESGSLSARDCLGKTLAVQVSKREYINGEGRQVVVNDIADFMSLNQQASNDFKDDDIKF